MSISINIQQYIIDILEKIAAPSFWITLYRSIESVNKYAV